jgi:hypothetical protein
MSGIQNFIQQLQQLQRRYINSNKISVPSYKVSLNCFKIMCPSTTIPGEIFSI